MSRAGSGYLPSGHGVRESRAGCKMMTGKGVYNHIRGNSQPVLGLKPLDIGFQVEVTPAI